ncbi:hypothetical protein PIB30_002833 [Stylosanthes scabra]|uniref:Uncharacterized protein n=1 Tax=Stylosanthes scabra TaxID=79078 RepID=A0ABU6T2R8_9FABA|nr:hypothetical protein [Stylosanthes scabra]
MTTIRQKPTRSAAPMQYGEGNNTHSSNDICNNDSILTRLWLQWAATMLSPATSPARSDTTNSGGSNGSNLSFFLLSLHRDTFSLQNPISLSSTVTAVGLGGAASPSSPLLFRAVEWEVWVLVRGRE